MDNNQNVIVMRICDIVNKETGKTYRQENAEKVHNIPIGSLVECVDTGVRLFVVSHERDCDGTPLYSLSYDREDTVKIKDGFANPSWTTGHMEDFITVISLPEGD